MPHYISTNRSKHYLKCHLILVTKYRRNILVGRYDTYEEALQARLEAEEKYWGIPLDTPVP